MLLFFGHMVWSACSIRVYHLNHFVWHLNTMFEEVPMPGKHVISQIRRGLRISMVCSIILGEVSTIEL
jgi:hypothetical protein